MFRILWFVVGKSLRREPYCVKPDAKYQIPELFTAGLFNMCSGACDSRQWYVDCDKKFRSVLKEGAAAVEKISGPFGRRGVGSL